MDIKHLQYFVAIVDHQFNISKAAESLFISQPALTKYIKEFEEKEGIELFVRNKGRLVELTPAGKAFLDDALVVLHDFDNLMNHIRDVKDNIKGVVRIGIPPITMQGLFSTPIAYFMIENPDIKLEIVELGAVELLKKLLLDEIDMAVLIEPVKAGNTVSRSIFSTDIVVICHKNHRLTTLNRPLTWKDLANEKIVIVNETFMLYHQIIERFKKELVTPNIFFKSGEWDLLASICERLDTITILPSVMYNRVKRKELVKLPLADDFRWNVTITKLKDKYHSPLVRFTEEYFTAFIKDKSRMNKGFVAIQEEEKNEVKYTTCQQSF